MSFDPATFKASEWFDAVAHLTHHKELGAHLAARYSGQLPTVQALILLADHGVADTAYSRKSKNYTFAQTIAASEGSFGDFEGAEIAPIFYDIAVDRYWPELDKVVNLKIARGTANFLSRNALEPQRLMDAVAYGAGVVDGFMENTVLYLCDLGAGNDMASEAMLSSLSYGNGAFATVNAAELLDFKLKFGTIDIDQSHPYNYLERFGGYDTAVYFGMMHSALEKGTLMLIDGWAALAAFALTMKFQPGIKEHVLLGSSFIGSIATDFMQQHGLQPLCEAANDLDGGKQFIELQKLVNTVWKAATLS